MVSADPVWHLRRCVGASLEVREREREFRACTGGRFGPFRGAMERGWRPLSGRRDLVPVDAQPVDSEESCDDDEAERPAVGDQSLEAGRQGNAFWLGNLHSVPFQWNEVRDSDLQADHQVDLRPRRTALNMAGLRGLQTSTGYGPPLPGCITAVPGASSGRRRHRFTVSSATTGFRMAPGRRRCIWLNCWSREAVMRSSETTRQSGTRGPASHVAKSATRGLQSGFVNA